MHRCALLVSLPILFFTADASAVSIDYQGSPTRSLNADVVVGADRDSLIGKDHDFDAAVSLAPLDSEVDAIVEFPEGYGDCSAAASQHSVMLSHSIVAICHANVDAFVSAAAPSNIPVRSVGASQLAVRFQIAQPTPFTFYVDLTSFDFIGVLGEGAVTVTLSRIEPPTGATIVSADAQAVYSHTVVHAGTLEAGEYVLHVHAVASGNDAQTPHPSIIHWAEARIKLSLGENPSADLNDDGTVDGYDLALLLGTWSPCGGSCYFDPTHMLADLDNNVLVNGGDLALLLASWR